MKQSKHDQQVERDMEDATARDNARRAEEPRILVADKPVKESLWTKLKRAIGVVP